MTTARKSGLSLQLTRAELVLLNNALNQALELADGDFSTLVGGSKRSAERLLARLGAALSPTAKGGPKPSK